MTCQVRHRSSLIGTCMLIVLSLALAPLPAASADEVAWEQERVTELAVELAVTMRDLRAAVRRTAWDDRVRGQANRRHRLIDHLRVLGNETRFLAAELEAGQGFAETLPIAQRIDRLVDRAVVDGRRLFLTAPVQKRIDRANELIEELRPFYRGYATPTDAQD